jgi:hypothetical protein
VKPVGANGFPFQKSSQFRPPEPHTTMKNQGCIDACNKLLRGELSAIETYEQAIGKFSGEPEEATLQELCDSHASSAGILRQHVHSMGGIPSTDSGIWGAFAQAVEGTSKLFGKAAALQALITGEEHGIGEYEEAISNPEVMFEIRQTIENTLLPALRRNIATLQALQNET